MAKLESDHGRLLITFQYLGKRCREYLEASRISANIGGRRKGFFARSTSTWPQVNSTMARNFRRLETLNVSFWRNRAP